MKIKNTLSFFALLMIFSACSGGGGSGLSSDGAIPKDGIPDFNSIIDANACMRPYENIMGEDDYWVEEFGNAIRSGNAPCVKKVIQLGKIDVNEPIVDFFDAKPKLPVWRSLSDEVFFFSRKSPYDVIKVLVEAGANIKILNESGETPLLFVQKHTNQKDYGSVAQYLIQTKEINLDHMDNDGKASVHYTIDSENPVTMAMLIAQKPNLNLQSSNGVYPIFQAISNKWLDGTEKLIAGGVDIEVTDSNRNLPLHAAIQQTLTSAALKLALKVAPAKRDQTNSFGQTPLWISLKMQNYEVAKNLLTVLKVNTNIGNSEAAPLHLALLWNNAEIRKIVIEKVAKENLDVKNSEKESGIHIATRNHDTISVKGLLQRGANPDATNGNKQTALHLATKSDFKDIMGDLIRADASVNATDDSGNAPLHFAATSEVAQILINAKADKDLKNGEAKSPIVLAALNGRDSLFMYFAGIDARIDWVGANNSNLLHVAAGNGMQGSVNFLVQKINVNSPTSDGRTPLFYARNVTTFDSIKSAGGNIEHEDSKGGDTVFTFHVKSYTSTLSKDTLEIVRRLVTLKANSNHKTGADRETVIFYVTRMANHLDFQNNPKRFPDLYQVLLTSDIDLNLTNVSKKTVLFYADTVEEINDLRRGSQSGPVNTGSKDAVGLTAMDYAQDVIDQTSKDISALNQLIAKLNLDLQKAKEAGNTNEAGDIQDDLDDQVATKAEAEKLKLEQEQLLKAMLL